jgi:autotransporter-associated beta strand protein
MNRKKQSERWNMLTGVALGAFMMSCGLAQAADKDVVNTNADWNTAADWEGGTLPTGGDNVYIHVTNTAVKTIALASTPVNPGVTKVVVARQGTGTVIVNHTGGSLAVSNSFYIGNTGTPAPGTGIWNMSGDAVLNMYAGNTIIGHGSGTTGELNLSGNAQFIHQSTDKLFVGAYSTGAGTKGAIRLSDASKLTLQGDLVLGNIKSAIGSLTVSNTAQVIVSNKIIMVGLNGGATGTVTLADNSIVTMAGSGAEFRIGDNWGVGSMTMNGSAVLNATNWFAVGRLYGSGTLTINGGTINKTFTSGSYMSVGIMGSTGYLIQNGGYVSNTVSDLRLGSQWNAVPGNGTYDLNGGVLETYRVVRVDTNSTGLFNFNGGTLKAATDSTTFLEGLTAATVKSGGAVIDSNGKSITIAQSLLDGGVGGGLVKLGTGMLTLSGTNTYTGVTTISNGYLRLGWAQTLPASANVTVAGGTYDLGGFTVTNGAVTLNTGWIINGTLNASALNVSGDQVIRANLAGNGVLTKSGSGTLRMENFSGGSNVVSGGTLKIGPIPVPSVMAESLAWFDASDAATITTNAEGGVTNWANKGTAGATLDAVLFNPTNIPFVTPNALNGRSVLTVTNTYALLTKGNTGITGGVDRTMFAVGCRQNSGTMHLAFLGYRTPDNSAFAISSQSDSLKYATWNNDITLPVRANGVHEIYDFMMASSNGTANLISGGVLSSQSKACTPNTASSKLYLGYSPNYVTSQGDLAEVILFNRALTAQERGDVEAYLRSKWFPATPPPAGDVVITSPGVLYISEGTHTVRSLTINGELQTRNKVYSAATLPGLIEGPGSLFTTSGAPPKGTLIRIF